jgi:hypothetical protein
MAYLNFQIKNYNGHGTSSAPSGDQMFYDFMTFMVTNGWTVPQSSDGLTFNQSGTNKITQAGTGTGGMANPGSWFILKEPSPGIGGNRREFMFFKNTSSYTDPSQGWYRTVAYSVQGFSTVAGNGHGSASTSATNPPIAFDEIWTSGGSTFQNPTNCYAATIGAAVPANTISQNYWADANSTYNQNQYVFCCSSSAPFFWYLLVINDNITLHNSATTQALMMYDPLNTYESSEPDPSVFFYTNGFGNTTITSLFPCTYSANKFYFTWMNYVSFTSKTDANSRINTAHTTIPCYSGDIAGLASFYGSTLWADGGSQTVGLSAYKHKVSLPSLYVYQDWNTAKRYIKGYSKYVRSTLCMSTPFRLETVVSPNDYIYIPIYAGGGLNERTFTMLPWNGSVLPIL